jgi:RNA polymerase sigma-70 factor (ECF subfamily)
MADLTSPSQAAIRDETARKIEEVLGTMDEIDREVLILRHFEQLSNDEVAGVIGVKKAAASSRYMRALARFHEVVKTIPGCDFGARKPWS